MYIVVRDLSRRIVLVLLTRMQYALWNFHENKWIVCSTTTVFKWLCCVILPK